MLQNYIDIMLQSLEKKEKVLDNIIELNKEQRIALENPDLFHLFNEYREKLSVLPAARFNSENAAKKLKDFFDVQTLDAFGNFSRVRMS